MTNTLALIWDTLKTMTTFFYNLLTATPIGIFLLAFIAASLIFFMLHLFRSTASLETFGEDPFDEDDYR
jgi:hypothetical protein